MRSIQPLNLKASSVKICHNRHCTKQWHVNSYESKHQRRVNRKSHDFDGCFQMDINRCTGVIMDAQPNIYYWVEFKIFLHKAPAWAWAEPGPGLSLVPRPGSWYFKARAEPGPAHHYCKARSNSRWLYPERSGSLSSSHFRGCSTGSEGVSMSDPFFVYFMFVILTPCSKHSLGL